MSDKLKVLKIIHMAICAGLILLYIVLAPVLGGKFAIPVIHTENVLYIAIPVFAISVSHFVFRSMLKQADRTRNLEEHFPAYQTASIVRWGVLEGAAILILVLNPDFMVLGMVIILYLIFLRPNEEGMRSDLNYRE